MIVIIDTNLLISAYTCDGEVRKHYLHDLDLVDLFISPEIFIEVERNLRRKEFNLEYSEIAIILRDILDRCEITRINCKPGPFMVHGSDWHMHALVDQIGADFILTGDKGFLESASMKGVPCKRIHDFVSQYKAMVRCK